LCYYGGLNANILQAYFNVDLVIDLFDRKSHSGLFVSMNGVLILWGNRKQIDIVSSTTEVEYVVTNIATSKVVWT
jgi:hypothetical protein